MIEVIYLFALAKLHQKSIYTKLFVAYFVKTLTFCYLIDINQGKMLFYSTLSVRVNNKYCINHSFKFLNVNASIVRSSLCSVSPTNWWTAAVIVSISC